MFRLLKTPLIVFTLLIAHLATLQAEDGYELWLRYNPVSNNDLKTSYSQAITNVVCVEDSEVFDSAKKEILLGLNGLLETNLSTSKQRNTNTLILGTAKGNKTIKTFVSKKEFKQAGKEGYILKHVSTDDSNTTIIAANSDAGVLYGVFAFLRHIQTGQSLTTLDTVSSPKIDLRVINHWDNLTRTVERVGSGFSIYEWFDLPDYVNPRLTDYARACSSIGINHISLTNVNANAYVLTPQFLVKVQAIADAFRPYGIKVMLTARFSAPIQLDGIENADPLNPDVQQWWTDKINEIYTYVPDFGGFLVKANSEGQPGPQDYGRNHADGANMLADALAPHNGVVMWRAFVYSFESGVDRHKQAYNEFVPLDGQFRDNVYIQIKNGAIDFMPREPFSPLFGATPKTSQTMELQITQEYMGHAVHTTFLAPMWKETLDTDTFRPEEGSTVARVLDGSIKDRRKGAIAGVSNVSDARTWTGNPLLQSNWYAYGRLAWDHSLSSEQIADEWTRMTFSNDIDVVSTINDILLDSHEAAVNYRNPIGIHHIMASGHHYGPGPWVHESGRPDWTSKYYHRADAAGLGFNRTETGSNALEQYADEIRIPWSNPDTIPLKYLLWFHHIEWGKELRTGRTMWNELGYRYQSGVQEVGTWVNAWASLEDKIDHQRWDHVRVLLNRQEREAKFWRDSCLLYFQSYHDLPLPEGIDQPEHNLEYYKNYEWHHVPGHPGSSWGG